MRFPLSAREQIASVGPAKRRSRTGHWDGGQSPNRRHFFLMDNPEQTNSAVPYYRDVCRRTYHDFRAYAPLHAVADGFPHGSSHHFRALIRLLPR